MVSEYESVGWYPYISLWKGIFRTTRRHQSVPLLTFRTSTSLAYVLVMQTKGVSFCVCFFTLCLFESTRFLSLGNSKARFPSSVAVACRLKRIRRVYRKMQTMLSVMVTPGSGGSSPAAAPTIVHLYLWSRGLKKKKKKEKKRKEGFSPLELATFYL